MKRREFLHTTIKVLPLATSAVSGAVPESNLGWRTSILEFLEELRKPDGGYSWPDQDRSHLTPTFGAVGAYYALGQTPPKVNSLATFIREHHPFRLKKLARDLKYFEYQQIQGLLWLREDASSFGEQVRTWRKPFTYVKRYEQNGYPILQIELMAFICRRLLSLPMDDIDPQFIEYLDTRRRPNGSYNNTPASDGSDGHIMNTWWGIQALDTLDRLNQQRTETVAWVQASQCASGGFTYQPKPTSAGVEDLSYTWAATSILHRLGSAPVRIEACIDYLYSLQNEDAGFGHRQGWPSCPLGTYRALEALSLLGRLSTPPPKSRQLRTATQKRNPLARNLQICSVQLEAPGKGSPAEAVEMARSLKIDLWGAKNADPEWITRAQSLAERQGVPVTFFVSDEEYGTFVSLPGLGTYSHTSDIIAPAGADRGPSLAGGEAVTWEAFRSRRLRPLQKAAGRLIWQFSENEELTRIYLDDSLERTGYAAISSFHFGNPDFVNSEPFLHLYWQRLPFVALQDAHTSEAWWWGDQITGFRTLFLATEPTWEGWLEALENNWVVAVRNDAVSHFETWMHGGSPEVMELVRRAEPQWRWWNSRRVVRPDVSIVAVRPEDSFESMRPRHGINVRVRCRWDNTAQGRPKTPRVKLIRLEIDGREVKPLLASPTTEDGAYQDYCHWYHMDNPSPGSHMAKATVRRIEDQSVLAQTLEFES